MAQTASIVRDWRRPDPGVIRSYPMAASQTIYEGQMVALNVSGLALKASNAATGFVVVGMAIEEKTNGTTAGATSIRVRAPVEVLLKSSVDITQADVGEVVYVNDDETFQKVVGTGSVRMGYITEFVATRSAWVLCDPAANIMSTT